MNIKNSSTKLYAVIVASVISFFSSIFVIFVFFHVLEQFWALLLITLLSFFILAYILTYYTLNNFIIRRIEPIYQTINSIKIPSEELYRNIENKDIITEVNVEVIDWAKSRTREIDELKANERYRKEFLGNVSHELKTPIFNIQGYILTLLDGGLYDESINEKYLSQAAKNINRLISIVEELETINKLESGELKLNYKVFNIIALAKEMVELHEITAQNSHISIILENDSSKPIMVFADKKKISQVFENLLSNSIKYGKQEGETRIRMRQDEERIHVEIQDTGIGIAPEHLTRIFERFYRVDKSRSREQGGTGLGLSIVKHIIEAHNQKLTVKSEINKGTVFKFTLDCAKKI